MRSAKRGIGPARPASTFSLTDTVVRRRGTEEDDEPLHGGGVIAPFDTVVVGCLWMMRGLEAASVLAEQVDVTDDGRKATIELGPTKMNPEGRSCPRSLVCSCKGEEPESKWCCPTHALMRIMAARRKLGLTGKHCLVCDKVGKSVTARRTIESIRRATGDVLATEHSMRRSGAQWYAAKGVALFIIQFIGRWGSSTVEKYVGNALHGSGSSSFNGRSEHASPKR